MRNEFDSNAPSASPVFYRTYSKRNQAGSRETWTEMTIRTITAIGEIGKLTADEVELLLWMQLNQVTLSSGRWLWVGGTDWVEDPRNFAGAYNCSSTVIDSWQSLAMLMSLAMTGCGTGAVLEKENVSKIPSVCNKLIVTTSGQPGDLEPEHRRERTRSVIVSANSVVITVGDSRQGWVSAYQELLQLSSDPSMATTIEVNVILSHVRPKGEKLKRFGGVANPAKLPELFGRVASILNRAVGRKISPLECCLLIDEAALVVVAGNLRRSAGMRQFSSDDSEAATAKDNLWQQDEEGNWRIDPERDALRMANHTRVFHYKPTLDEVIAAVRKQYYSGEGAIQYAPEAIARCSADLLDTPEKKQRFIDTYCFSKSDAQDYLEDLSQEKYKRSDEIPDRLMRYGTNPCLRGDMNLLTPTGYRPIKSLVGENVEIINKDGAVSVGRIWCSGEKPIVRIALTTGATIFCTEDHVWMTADGDEVPAINLAGERLMPFLKVPEHNPRFVLAGFIQGDGNVGDINNETKRGIGINIGKKDLDIVSLFDAAEIEYTWHGNRAVYSRGAKDLAIESGIPPVALPSRALPDGFALLSENMRAAFLSGLYSANGCVLANGRIALKTTCKALAEQVEIALKQFGIDAYITTNKSRETLFSNGVYQCRESYNVSIQKYSSRVAFFNLIGFAVRYKTEKLAQALLEQSPVVRSVYSYGVDKVYDFTEPLTHWGVVEGFVSHNCGEIEMNNNFCNLSEVHLNRIHPGDIEDQEKAFTAAALSVCALLHHDFSEVDPRYQKSRLIDPIVAASVTGLFDFFVEAFGPAWLDWWAAGRPNTEEGLNFKKREATFLIRWRNTVRDTVNDYCDRHGLRRPNRYTTVQPAGCGSRELLRVFDQGLIYADEIMADGEGEVKETGLTVRGGIPANTGIANQPLQLVRVTLSNGRILRLTPNHRLSVEGQWVCADELIPGMQIDYQIGAYTSKEEAVLLPVDLTAYVKYNADLAIGDYRKGYLINVRIPERMDPKLAYFLGALFGNGCCGVRNGTHRIRFCHGSKDVINHLAGIAGELFGILGTLNDEGNRIELCLASKPIYDWLSINELMKDCKSKDLDRIPTAIRRSSAESILGFFCGLIDTDGCVRESGSLFIDSASENFIRNLQQIGEAVGLCFAISHNTQGSNHQEQKSIWSLVLSRMLSSPDALAFLNKESLKCQARPLPSPRRSFKFTPYAVASVEWEQEPDYSFDFAVAGVDDDDSWYWQGALKSHNTKSLLTGASPGWHPPKARYFIRRITFGKNDPVALACIDYGYNVVPSQSDRDENGNLLDDPFDPRCTEWLVEIPTAVPWADQSDVDVSKFSALAQFDFYMQVQKYYTTHNCFSRNTRFMTDKGIKSFLDFEVGDTVTVLNADGDWVPAEVVNTGEPRQMLHIRIREGKTGREKTIVSTPCHRFPVRRCSGGASSVFIKEARHLKIGHRLVLNTPDLPELYAPAICHGIVFGDGSIYRSCSGEEKGSQVYLCGGKRELIKYFHGFERLYERDDIDQTRIYGMPADWKRLPNPDKCSQEYLAGFIAGLLATDGSVFKSCISISSARQDVADFLREQCPRLGIRVTSVKWYESNGYKEHSGAFAISIAKYSFPSNMILRPHHLEHYESKSSQPCQWKIMEILEGAEEEMGWCVMEPKTNHFTLEDGILVMNTSATIEYRESEIVPLATAIHNAIAHDDGYISAALLARFDDLQNYPRLPFEPVSSEEYHRLLAEVEARRVNDDFHDALDRYDTTGQGEGPAPCDSDKCLIGGGGKK